VPRSDTSEGWGLCCDLKGNIKGRARASAWQGNYLDKKHSVPGGPWLSISVPSYMLYNLFAYTQFIFHSFAWSIFLLIVSSSWLLLGRITESDVPFGVVLCGVGLEMDNHWFVAAAATLSSLIYHVSGYLCSLPYCSTPFRCTWWFLGFYYLSICVTVHGFNSHRMVLIAGLAACITVFSVKTLKLMEVISDFTCCVQHPEIPRHTRLICITRAYG
jgi:hypothetical protein